MKKILLAFLLYLMLFSLKSQNSSFTYTTVYFTDAEIFDAVEVNGKYTFVGMADTMNLKQVPFILQLDKNGNLVNEHFVPTAGRFSNVFYRGSTYIMIFTSSDSTFLSEYLIMDTLFNVLSSPHSIFGNIEKSKIINDTILASIGHLPGANRKYSSMVSIYSLNQGWGNELLSDESIHPRAFYDIVKTDKGYHILWEKDSLIPEDIMIVSIHDSIKPSVIIPIDTASLYTSTNNPYINTQDMLGPASALALSDTSFMVVGRIKNPQYNNQIRNEDVGIMVWDTAYNELNMNIIGKSDTNEYVSGKSISKYGSNIYIGGTSNYDTSIYQTSEFILTKTDAQGNPLWTKYYGNNTKLVLNKVLATSDGGAIMVGSSYDTLNFPPNVRDIHIVKVDSNGMQTISSLKENILETKTIVYPNPSSSTINFSMSIGELQEEMNLEIYNSNGQFIQQKSILPTETVDVSDFDAGLYFYTIHVDDKIFKGKFIVGTD